MTKVVFYETSDIFWGYEEAGHAELDDSDVDVLCASISAMTMLVVNAVEETYKSKINYEVDEENALVRVEALGALPGHELDEKKRYAISGLFKAYYRQLKLLEEEFPKNLRVLVIKKKPTV